MPKMEFDDKKVDELKLKKGKVQEDYFQRMKRGLSLVLTVGKEKKTWSVMFYENGKPRRKKLGYYSDMNHEAAFAAAAAFNKNASSEVGAGSFEEVAETFLKRYVRARGLRSEHEIVRILKSNIYPMWKDRPFTEIKRKDVADLRDAIEDKSGPGVADSTLAIIRGVMRWYQTRDDDYVCPVVPGMRRLDKAPKRQRWLEDDEIDKLWRECDRAGVYGATVRVLLATGQRLAKVNEMKWEDIDLGTGVWTIPREEREKGAPRKITLPSLALEVIKQQFRIADNPFVFAGLNGSHIRATSTAKERLDAVLQFSEPWRLHDLRRTARRLMTHAKVPTEAAELALGRSIKGIQGVYDDPDEYRPMIDDALRKVEVEIVRILRPETKVVAFSR